MTETPNQVRIRIVSQENLINAKSIMAKMSGQMYPRQVSQENLTYAKFAAAKTLRPNVLEASESGKSNP